MASTILHNFRTGKGRLNALIVALFFVMPTGWNPGVSILLLLLLVQSVILFGASDWLQALKNPVVISSMAYFTYLALSLIWTDDVSEGGRQLETKASFFIAPLLIFAGAKYWNDGWKDRVLKSFWVGTLLSILIALAYAAFRSIEAGGLSVTHEAGTRYFFLYKHLSSPIMHPGYMATYVGIALFIAIYFIRKTRIRLEKRQMGLSILLFGAIMILLQARINLIALLLVMGMGVIYYAWLQKRYVLFSVPFIGAALLLLGIALAPKGVSDRYFQLPQFNYDISGDASDFNSATYRLAIWSSARDVIETQPVIGTGIGDNRTALVDMYAENTFWQGVEREFNAHNQYLETWVAGGLIGLLLFGAIFLVLFARAIATKNYLLLAIVGFIAISLLTESMFERMWAVVLFTVAMPAMLVFRSKHEGLE